MKSNVIRIVILSGFFLFAFPPALFELTSLVMGFPPPGPPNQHNTCNVTESGPPCGTNLVLSHGTCTSGPSPVTCNTDEIVFGQILNCKGNQVSGLSSCGVFPCYKQRITRACNDNGQCVVTNDGQQQTVIANGSVAAGGSCSGGSPDGGLDPTPGDGGGG